MTDEVSSLGEPNLVPRKFGDADQLLEDLSKSSVVGIAVCDADLRYLSISDTMAGFNGLPPDAHIGKTVPEIIGQAALTVEPLMKSVLSTGQSATNIEIVAELPTRNEPGHWIADFLPIRDSSGRARQIIAFAVEITRQRKLEQCLLTIMKNLPRIRDQVTCVGLPDRSEHDRVESLRGAIELLGHCVEEMRPVAGLLQPGLAEGYGALQSLDIPPSQDVLPPLEHSGELIKTGLKLLTKREIETVRQLAAGKGSKEVAAALGLSTRTVESYKARIMAKLSYHTTSELVRFAVRTRLISA